MARQGAKVIVVDSSAERLTAARRLAEAADVRVEFHHGDLADLAFVRGDQIDQALAVYSLAAVDDISRVFRQVHRVLRTEAPFVISLPHPIELICSDETAGAPRLQRSAFDRSPIIGGQFGPTVIPHRMTDVFTELVRSNFRPDALLEPADGDVSSGASAERRRWIPSTVIIRGRKQGI